MKTKIIYISGGETFEMAQIRAAFEEVRNTLGLDNDTVLFGVPVDADCALANPTTVQDTQIEPISTPAVIDTEDTTPAFIEPIPEYKPEIIAEVPTPEIVEEPVFDAKEEETYDIVEEPETDTPAPEEKEEETPIIPILSVLGGEDTQAVAPNIEEVAEVVAEVGSESESVAGENEPEIDTVPETDDALQVSISDIVASDVPAPASEKTLEELLESMTPLGEDEIPETQTSPVDDTVPESEADFSISMNDDVADTDATLEQLANEFAQAQDSIPEPAKQTGGGKIGKLKNILPFKKAKRDDSGLMGDLFGWAGIAANDEDFSIPGFFTSAGGQK